MALTSIPLSQPGLTSADVAPEQSEVGLAFDKGARLLTGSMGVTFKGFGGDFLANLGLEEAGNRWLSDAYQSGILMGMDVNEIDERMKSPRTWEAVDDWKGGLAWGVNSVSEHIPTLMMQFIPAVVAGVLTKTTPLGRVAGAVGLGARGASTATALATIDFMNTAEVYSELLMQTGESRPAVAATTGGLMTILDAVIPLKILGRMGYGPDFTRWFGKQLRNPVKKLPAMMARNIAYGAGEGVTERVQTMFEGMALNYVEEKGILSEFSAEQQAEQKEAGARGLLIGTLLGIPVSYRGPNRAVERAGKKFSALERSMANLSEGQTTEQAAAQLSPESHFVSQLDGFNSPVTNMIREKAETGVARGPTDTHYTDFADPERTFADIADEPVGKVFGKQTRTTPRVGDFVQWTSMGVDQLPTPARIIDIQRDEDGNGWARVEGYMTFLPLSELTIPATTSEGQFIPQADPYTLGTGTLAGKPYTYIQEGRAPQPGDDLRRGSSVLESSWVNPDRGKSTTPSFKKSLYTALLEGRAPQAEDDLRRAFGTPRQPSQPERKLPGMPTDPALTGPPGSILPTHIPGWLEGEGAEIAERELGQPGIGVEERGRQQIRRGIAPWSYAGKGAETKTAQMAFFGYEKTGEQTMLNKDDTPSKVQSKEGNSIYESADYIIKKEHPRRGAPWVAINKETGEITRAEAKLEAALDLAKAHPSAAIDVTTQTRDDRLAVAAAAQEEIGAISFEQVLAQQGRITAKVGDKVRLYEKVDLHRDPDLPGRKPRWVYPDDRVWTLQSIDHTTPEGITAPYNVGTPVTSVYKLEPASGSLVTIEIGPTEDNIRIVPQRRADWNFAEYYGEPESEAEAIVREDLTTDEVKEELRQFTSQGAQEILKEDIQANRDEFMRLIREDTQFFNRLAEALYIAQHLRGERTDKVSDNITKLRRRTRAEIETFIGEAYLTHEEITAKYNKELLDYERMTRGELSDQLRGRTTRAQLETDKRIEGGEVDDETGVTPPAPEVDRPLAEQAADVKALTDVRELEQDEPTRLKETAGVARPREEYTDAFRKAMTERRKDLAERMGMKSVTLTSEEINQLKVEFADEGRQVWKIVKSTKAAPFSAAEETRQFAAAQALLTREITKADDKAAGVTQPVEPERDWLEAVPKGENLVDTIDPDSRMLPAPETHRVQVNRKVAEKLGLGPTIFYPYSVSTFFPDHINVQGKYVDKKDVIKLEESKDTITVDTGDFVEFYSENFFETKRIKKGFRTESVVELPNALPDQDRIRRAWIDNKDGLIIVQSLPSAATPPLASTISAPSMRVDEIGEYSELGYDYDIYRTWESREEHEAKIKAERERLLNLDRESRAKEGEYKGEIRKRDVTTTVNLSDDKKFLTTDYEKNTRRGQIRLTLSPTALVRINRARREASMDMTGLSFPETPVKLEPLGADDTFTVERAYGRETIPPPGAAFAIDKKKPSAPTQSAWLDALRQGPVSVAVYGDRRTKEGKIPKIIETGVKAKEVKDRERLIESGAQLWSTAGIPVPIKNKLVITDRDGYQYTINIESAKTASITQIDLPEQIKIMTSADVLADEAPETGVQLITSFRGDVKEDVDSLKEFMVDLFSPATHRFGILNEDLNKVKEQRTKDLVAAKGLDVLIDFHDGRVVEGKIGQIYWGRVRTGRASANTFGLVVKDSDQPLIVDILAYDRMQIDVPIEQRKAGDILKGWGPDYKGAEINDIHINSTSLTTYYPILGKGYYGKLKRDVVQPTAAPVNIEAGQLRVEVTRDGDHYFVLSDESVTGKAFSLDQVLGYLNELSAGVLFDGVEGLNVIKLPDNIVFDTVKEKMAVKKDIDLYRIQEVIPTDVDRDRLVFRKSGAAPPRFEYMKWDKETKQWVADAERSVARVVEEGNLPVDTTRVANEGGTVTQIQFNTPVTIRKPNARKDVTGMFDPTFTGLTRVYKGKKTTQMGLVNIGNKRMVNFIPDKGKPERLDFDTLHIIDNPAQTEESLNKDINTLATGIAKEANAGLTNAPPVVEPDQVNEVQNKEVAKVDDALKKNIVADDKIKKYEDVKVTPMGLLPVGRKFNDSQGTEWKVASHVGRIDRTILRYVGGKKPSEAIFKVAYEGKKGEEGWVKNMEVIVESNVTPAGLFTPQHKPSKRAQPQGIEEIDGGLTELGSLPNYSIIRSAPLNGERGSITLNTGLTPARFKELLSKRIGRLNLLRAEKEGTIRIVQNQTDVPNSPDSIGVKAMIRDGKLWLVTNNIYEGEIMGVFTHEVGVHLGLPEVYGKQYEYILESARSLRDSSPEWRSAFQSAEELAAKLLKAPESLSDAHRKKWEEMTDIDVQKFITEEAIGYYVEDANPYKDSFWSILIDLFNRGSARIKRLFGKPMNEREIIAFIRGGVRGMVGRNMNVAHNRITEYYSAVLSGTPEYWDDAVIADIEAKLKDHDSFEVLKKVEAGRGFVQGARKFFNPFAYLPQEALLRKLRGEMQGKLGEVDEAGKELLKIYDNLSDEDNAELFNFFTEKFALPEDISNVKLRDISVKMKRAISDIGQKAYEKEIFKGEAETQFKEFQGAYLPQVFLYHILAGRNTSTPFGRKMSQQHWTEARIGLDEASKQAKVPVTDMQYLLYKAFTVPQQDMIIMDYLETLSEKQAFTPREVPTGEVYKTGKKKGQPKMRTETDVGFIPWVMPNQWIRYDSINSEGKTVKRRTTLAGLRNEMEGLKELVGHPHTTDSQRRLIESRLAELAKVRGKFYEDLDLDADASDAQVNAFFNTAYNTKHFRQIPDNRRYGALAGFWVRKEIYEDIVGNADLKTGEQGFFTKWLNPYGTQAKLVGIWKTLKVPMNPPTVVRNFISNMILMQLSGLPFHQQPKYLMAALREMKGDKSGITFKDSVTGKTFTAYDLAKRLGIGSSTMTSAEIRSMESVIRDMEKHGQWGILTHGQKKWKKISDMAGSFYQNVEVLGKTAFIMHALESRRGELEAITLEPKNLGPDKKPLITIEEAAVQESNLALFDYSEVSPTVKALRSSFFGAPFLTFQTKVAPLLLRTARRHPMRFLPYVMMAASMQAVFGGLPFVDDDWDKIKKLLPEWARDRGHMFLLPWKNMDGNVQAIDVSYFFPWTAFIEVGRAVGQGRFKEAAFEGGIIGPGFQLAAAVITGKDAWSGRDIINENDSKADKMFDILSYGAQMSMPPFLTRRGILSMDSLLEAAVRLDHHEIEGKLADAMMGKVNRYGEPKRDYIQAMLSLVGLNSYNINPNARSVEVKRFLSDQRRLKREMSGIKKDKSLSTKQKKRQVNNLRERIDRKREDRRRYQRETAGIVRKW